LLAHRRCTVTTSSRLFGPILFVTVSLSTCWTTAALAVWPTDPVVNVPICNRSTSYPVAISDGAGGAIFAWEDESGISLPGDIYVQRINASGVVQWTANGVALTLDLDDQLQPHMVSDGAGGAIVVWQDGRNFDVSGYDLYAQRVNASGTPLWTANGVPV